MSTDSVRLPGPGKTTLFSVTIAATALLAYGAVKTWRSRHGKTCNFDSHLELEEPAASLLISQPPPNNEIPEGAEPRISVDPPRHNKRNSRCGKNKSRQSPLRESETKPEPAPKPAPRPAPEILGVQVVQASVSKTVSPGEVFRCDWVEVGVSSEFWGVEVAIRNFSQPNLKVEFDNGHRDHLPAPQGSQVYLTQSNLPCRLVNKDRTLCTLTTVS
mmetsp:Transcript_30448/g.71529  ORF Transcript_30448/g.71529 Transcript_30448/m.71529 type:complete len:216 (-) Transcript_30448:76-723(-)|eukprot:CAMPEP_0175912786 /NCGR_PEP_ID=MMETSP0108-20121206/8917_1 /TAXON_ID=195067 ORGANISM="Goniomonas pacifica, Strain CCMP1869" /NCGR_SAMPLE_ID=MMETSP0108 /ASSEMBLY_ACC=CAM_ASM_000204 /LENGTH=215 /DNA_ID=CAMNT_0017235131 /DNA_START=52 /DNA_END=699 /DNA_ORIENTATION=-